MNTLLPQTPIQQTNDLIIIKNLEAAQNIVVSNNENKTLLLLLLDNGENSGEIKVTIKGENAKVQILGAIVGSGTQNIKLHTVQDHRGKNSTSDLLIKSVLFGQARLNYSGLINIEVGASKSNAYQKNQNILMSPKSWVQSRPYLEIKANDVRCTHGATIGKIDNEQMYYLKSRGISQTKAEKLILAGFLGEVINRIEDDKIKEEILKEIDKKLDNLLI